MKFLSGLAILALVGMFTSCEETEDPVGPSINLIGSGGFIASNVTVEVSDDLYFKWSATAGDAKLSTFTIYKDGAIVPDWNMVEIPNSESDAYSAADTLSAPSTVGMYTYSFVVTDKDGLADTTSVDVNVVKTAVDLANFDVVLLGAQSSSEPSCASLETGVRYAISGDEAKTNSASVDIVHYNGSKDVAIYAPSQTDIQAVSAYGISTWATKNATKFSLSTMSADDFDAISTDADLEDLGTPDKDFIGFLALDDVVIFETAGGKMGVFRVDAIVDDPAGSVTLNVKVEE